MNSQLHKKWTNRWENQQSQNVLEKINKIEKSPARLIKKKKKKGEKRETVKMRDEELPSVQTLK